MEKQKFIDCHNKPLNEMFKVIVDRNLTNYHPYKSREDLVCDLINDVRHERVFPNPYEYKTVLDTFDYKSWKIDFKNFYEMHKDYPCDNSSLDIYIKTCLVFIDFLNDSFGI